jgi:TolB-like protein
MSFMAELKRRNVIRMAGLYLVGAWLITQVAATVLPLFDAPDWMARSVVVLLGIGFVPALVIAWVFELTPEGLKRDADVDPAASIAPQTGKRMDRMIVVGLIAVIALMAIERLWFARSDEPVAASVATTAASATAPAQVEPRLNPKSIAVLAFANMSADKDNEYFSDGVAEEILNALAKVEDLRVAGRTSSFYFKGRNEPLAAIGATLGVAHVLEGSVRKQGEHLRINAKLLRVSDGVEMWSETFDGNDADIFALQENIARRVTGELKAALNAGQQDRLVDVGTGNAEAYALYLQASATFNRRDSARYSEAMAQLEQAATLDPGFARAYARLAALYAVALNADTVDYDVAVAAAEKFADRASQLDPSLAEPHAVRGLKFRYRRKHREGREAFTRALALEPDDVTSNFWWAITLTQTGYRRQGIAVLDHTLQLDPLLPNALFWRAREHIADGELDQADRLLRRAAEGGHSFVGLAQWQLEQARGNRGAAISALADGLEYFSTAFPAGTANVFARACFGDAEAKARARTLIDAHYASKPSYVSGVATYVLIHAGEPARGLALMQDRPTTNDGLIMGEMFSPTMAQARHAPEFAEFLRRMGLAAYWDEIGPPDQCRKDAKGNYACD